MKEELRECRKEGKEMRKCMEEDEMDEIERGGRRREEGRTRRCGERGGR